MRRDVEEERVELVDPLKPASQGRVALPFGNGLRLIRLEEASEGPPSRRHLLNAIHRLVQQFPVPCQVVGLRVAAVHPNDRDITDGGLRTGLNSSGFCLRWRLDRGRFRSGSSDDVRERLRIGLQKIIDEGLQGLKLEQQRAAHIAKSFTEALIDAGDQDRIQTVTSK